MKQVNVYRIVFLLFVVCLLPFSRSTAMAGTEGDGKCTAVVEKGLVIREVTVNEGPITKTKKTVTDADKSGYLNIIVTDGDTLVYRVEAGVTKEGVHTSMITYGAAFTGAKRIIMKSSDGKTFLGTVDGRKFTFIVKSKVNGQAQFNDGREKPVIKLEPSLVPKLMDLEKKMTAAEASCKFTAKPAVKHEINKNLDVVSYPKATANQDGYYYLPGGTEGSPACSSCLDGCANKAGDIACSWGDWIWETPIVCAGRMTAALAYDAACDIVCETPTSTCFPEPCGGPFLSCGTGDSCFGSNQCCENPSIVCNNICCTQGITKCASDGSCGCGDWPVCGDNCMSPDGHCCGNTTPCAKGHACCGTRCLNEGELCCGSNVCTQGEQCIHGKKGDVCCAGPLNDDGSCCGLNYPCGNTCCDATSSVCTGGTCCPREQACGNKCCAAGSTCKDASKGTCGGDSCPPGVASCNGECCPYASDSAGNVICCTPTGDYGKDVAPFNNTKHGCHHELFCTYSAPK